MSQPQYDQHIRNLRKVSRAQHSNLPKVTSLEKKAIEVAVTANVLAHYECGFIKDYLKVGVTSEGCIVATTKTYFETPKPDKLTPEEYRRLGSVLASLLDSIEAKQVDTETIERIKRVNDVEKKVKAIEETKRKV